MSTKDLLQELLLNEGQSHIVRRAFRERLVADGKTSLYDYVLADAQNGKPADSAMKADATVHRVAAADMASASPGIHELANVMLADGYFGQGLDNEEQAADYIYMAADNPDVEKELPEAGFAFWRAAKFKYKAWKARKARENA